MPIEKGNEQTFLAMLNKIKEQHLQYDEIILIWDGSPYPVLCMYYIGSANVFYRLISK